MEEQIVVVHLVDSKAFECDFGNGERIEVSPQEDLPIHVVTGGKEYPLGKRFIYDVLYGFETVDSCVQGLIKFARQLHEQLPVDIVAVHQAKPKVHFVESTEEAKKLAVSKDVPEDDLVVMPFELLEQIKSPTGKSKKETRELEKKRGHKPTYPTTNIEMLKKLISKDRKG